MAVKLVHVGPDLQTVVGWEAGRIDAWPGDHDHAQRGHEMFGLGKGGDYTTQEVAPDARAAHGDDADGFVGGVAQLVAQRGTVGEPRRVKACYVAGEVVVLFGPVPDRGKVGAEAVGHDVVRIADEDGAVTHPGVTGDLFDHLSVVVSGEERFAFGPVGHGKPAHEVSEPGVRRGFQLGVLVQEVVELPRLVADPQVVGFFSGDIVEHHEVGDEDFVHRPPGLEAVQIVLGGL